VHRYLPYLNVAINVLLGLAAWAYHSRTDVGGGVPEGLSLFLLLPGVVFAMGWMARRSMREIQAGLSELQGLRYEYKGA